MTEEQKKKIAQFRFGVIHDLIGDRKLRRGEKKRLLAEKSACEWDIPFSGRSFICASTILNWARRYEAGGRRIESLYPEPRNDRGRCRSLDDDTALALINLKKEYLHASVPVVIAKARRRKILPLDIKVSRATVYRLLERAGLMSLTKHHPDRRRFEAELPNDIWQSDALHGPEVLVDGKMRKVYLFAIIDDMSRVIPHAEFVPRERLQAFLRIYEQALRKRGIPRKLYVDNGPLFRSDQLRDITASLGTALIHAKPYQPEGKGKIERWFRTVRMQFLSILPSDVTLQKLNKRLWEWIDQNYHTSIHSSTRQTPLQRYLDHLHLIRPAPQNLSDAFRKRIKRKVDKDRTVSIDNKIFEAPVGLIDQKILLLYHEQDPTRVEAFHNGRSYGFLVPLDIHINAKIRRNHSQSIDIHPETNNPKPHKNNIYRGGSLFQKGQSHEKL